MTTMTATSKLHTVMGSIDTAQLLYVSGDDVRSAAALYDLAWACKQPAGL